MDGYYSRVDLAPLSISLAYTRVTLYGDVPSNKGSRAFRPRNNLLCMDFWLLSKTLQPFQLLLKSIWREFSHFARNILPAIRPGRKLIQRYLERYENGCLDTALPILVFARSRFGLQPFVGRKRGQSLQFVDEAIDVSSQYSEQF